MHNLSGASFCAPTLSVVLVNYLNVRTLKPETEHIYRWALTWGCSDWMHRPVNEINQIEILERHKALSTKQGPRGEGKSAADMTMRVVRTLINFAMIANRKPDGTPTVTHNPVHYLSAVDGWNPRNRRQTVIKGPQLKRWYKAVSAMDQPVFRDYILFLLFTGMRRSEGRLLRWSDVDFENRLVTARETKNGLDHTLPLSDYLYMMLSTRWHYVKPAPDDYIFPGRFKGTSISENYKGYIELWEAAGVKFKLHDLRRTYLTLGESLDIPITTLKWMANHSSSDVTFGYLVKDPERLRAPMDQITLALIELCGIS